MVVGLPGETKDGARKKFRYWTQTTGIDAQAAVLITEKAAQP